MIVALDQDILSQRTNHGSHGRIQGGGGPGVRTPPGILAKMFLSDS